VLITIALRSLNLKATGVLMAILVKNSLTHADGSWMCAP